MKKKILAVLIGMFAVVGTAFADIIASWTVGDYYVEHRVFGPNFFRIHAFTAWANGEIVFSDSYTVRYITGTGCTTTGKTLYINGKMAIQALQCVPGEEAVEENFCTDNPSMCLALKIN